MPRLSREIQFSNKVFSQSDLNKIVSFFSGLIVKRKKSEGYWDQQLVTITTTTQDGIDYSFDSSELDEVAGHFQQKQIVSLNISYDDRKTGNELTFRLSTGEYATSYFKFISGDEAWLNHHLAQANEQLFTIRDQNNFYLTNRSWIRPVGKFLLAIPITYIFLVLLVFLSKLLPPSEVVLDANQKALGVFYLYLFLIVLNMIFGGLIVGKLFKYLDSLWPPIEVNTGPEHLNRLVKQRKFWGILSSTVILPIIISAIFYFISGVRLF